MDAEVVLRAYKSGARDFRGKNLQEQSFAGQNLTGADFSFADIRGASFNNATLIEANFTGVKAGISFQWRVALLGLSVILAAVAGIASTQAGIVTLSTFSQKFIQAYTFIPAIIVSLVLCVFLIATINRGVLVGIAALAVTVSVAVPVGGLLGRMLAGMGPVGSVAALTPIGILCSAVATTEILILSSTKLLLRSIAIVSIVASISSGVVTWLVARFVASHGQGAIEKSLDIAASGEMGVAKVVGILAAVTIGLAIVLLGTYIGWRASLTEGKHAFVLELAVFLNTVRGTSFFRADLTDATFQEAMLKNTDFRNVTLVRTFWLGARGLEFARVGTSYLRNAQISRLVTTAEGESQKFDRLDLRGLNLCGANLVNASFIGANLDEAILKDANLQAAKLVQTQLNRTDLSGACLTGACIQDWGLTASTKIQGIKCEYIFMRLSQKKADGSYDDPYRKPDDLNEHFKEGEFSDFIAPLIKTLDLYHNQGVNPRSVVVAFKRLIENHPDAKLEIMAMEKKRKDKFFLRAKTSEKANLSQLSQEYFETYNRLRSLAGNDPLFTVAAHERVSGLEAMIVGLPSGLQDRAEGAQYSIQQLSTFTDFGRRRITELLKKIVWLIEVDQNLSTDDKSNALEQVKLLAEAAAFPTAYTKQQVTMSIRLLRGIMGNVLHPEDDNLFNDIYRCYELIFNS